jgi:hypothetical protein
VTKIESKLGLLLPIKREIRPNLTRIIDKAIDIANTMTRERLVFICTLIPHGCEIDDECMHVEDEDQTGKVFWCMFPTFGRIITEEGMDGSVCLVQADVELESAFSLYSGSSTLD